MNPSSNHTGARRAGAASHLLVAALSVAVGAAGAWTLGQRTAAAPASGHVTTHGEWVTIRRDADSIRAYVAYPERNTKAPAIIVIHEIYGLTEWEPTVADRFAAAGYVAIVPDLLSSRFGATPTSPDSGRKLVAQLEPDRVTADLDAVYTYANSLPAVSAGDIGTIGFCWGGGQSFRYATDNPKLKAAVVCYGPAPDSADMASIEARVLGIYGEDDARINAQLPEVQRQMRRLGKRFVAETYPGTGHGFLKPGRTGSDGPQVERAWGRILNFYRETLGK